MNSWLRVWVIVVIGLCGSRVWGESCDVLVYGATAGGVVASVAAAASGLEVILVEPGAHVGGMVSGGLTQTDHGNKNCIGGLSREFFERVGNRYGEDITWYFEPSIAEGVFLDWLDEAGVELVREAPLDSVDIADGVIGGIVAGGEAYTAKVFVDASYEGDLMARAGVGYTWGREGQDEYGESLAGRIAYSEKHQFLKPVSPHAADGSLLPFVYGGDPGEPGAGDRKVQAYNFRLCLTQRPEIRVPFPKPEGYDAAEYELLRRHLAANPELKMAELMTLRITKNGKTDTNNNGPFSTDYIGASWEYPEADYEKRAEIFDEHKRYTQGFLYFLGNDPSVPDALQAEVNTWGLAKDEHVDTGNWPPQLYIREARRMIGAYVMSQKDLQTERAKPDSIGMGSYNSDSHHVQRIPAAGSPVWGEDVPGVLNEGDMQVPVRPYEIAYRALTPKREEATNLLVVACVSASHVAYSSIRMEPQYMIMGHAAGVAASLAIRDGVGVQSIPVEELRATLHDQGAVLSVADFGEDYLDARKLPGVAIDNEDAVTRGAWRRSTSISPFVGLDYEHVVPEADGEKAIRYTPQLPEAGRYEIRVSYSPNPNRATNALLRIQTADGIVERRIDQQRGPTEREAFVSVGEFELRNDAWVEWSDAGADGYVVADAVQWLRVGD